MGLLGHGSGKKSKAKIKKKPTVLLETEDELNSIKAPSKSKSKRKISNKKDTKSVKKVSSNTSIETLNTKHANKSPEVSLVSHEIDKTTPPSKPKRKISKKETKIVKSVSSNTSIHTLNTKHPNKEPALMSPAIPDADTISLQSVRRVEGLGQLQRKASQESILPLPKPSDTSFFSHASTKTKANHYVPPKLQFASVNDERSCIGTCIDNLEYDWIRLKAWMRKKKDPSDGLQFDPATGEMVLTGAEIPEEELADYAETDIQCLPYSKDLHTALHILWYTINCTGRLPFHITMDFESNIASFRVKKWSPIYIINMFMMIFLWLLVIWVSIGFFLIFFYRRKGNNEPNANTPAIDVLKSQTTEYRLFKRFWLEIWFFYTTLIHAAYATSNQWYYGQEYALFVKKWYKAIDNGKVSVHESLRKFICYLYAIGLGYILLMIIAYSMREYFPSMVLTCQLFVAAFSIGFTPIADRSKLDAEGRLYFEKIEKEVFVFLLYCFVVLVSWQNSIIHLTFCRMFRNGIRAMNQRVLMILQPFKEPPVGPNAVRINIEDVRADYVNVVIAGLFQNKVFGLVLVSDMLWTILTVLFESLVLTFYGNEDPAHAEYLYRFNENYEGTNIKQLGPPEAYLANALGHIVTTLVRLFIVIWLPDQISTEAYKGYQIATEKGMVFAKTQPEKNFIRSIWLISVPRYPVVMTAKNFFKLTRGMICALLSSAFTYYIFSMQARTELSRILLGNWPDEVEEALKDNILVNPDVQTKNGTI